MKSKLLYYLAIGSFLLGLLFCALMLLQPVTLTVNGETTSVPSYGLTTGTLLKHQGLKLKPGDKVIPPGWFPLFLTGSVNLTTSAQVDVFNEGKLISFNSTERHPANLLQQAGIRLFPFDALLADGQSADMDTLLSPIMRHIIQYRIARLITYTDGSNSFTFYSSAETIGQALWKQGITLASWRFVIT